MNVSEYDYIYPESAIALKPPEIRGTSKLFIVYSQTGTIVQDIYENLDKYLVESDVLVRNQTKVFHARLFGEKYSVDNEQPGEVEVFILEPHAQSLEEYAKRQYDPIEKGFNLEFLSILKKNSLNRLSFIDFGDGYRMRKITKSGDTFSGIFYKYDEDITTEALFELLASKGKVPLPPYIKRATTVEDETRYQTIFAKNTGSVAAPTASLNFTKTLEHKLVTKGICIQEVTLHVGRGTFLPLRSPIIEENTLHSEPFYVSNATINTIHDAKNSLKRIVAMGTTSLRTLETIEAEIGSPTGRDVVSETNLFVFPPYSFKVVDCLLTNFHFPKSSLITLVDAFLQWKGAKLKWREIYEYAIANDANLFSYGDSMLIL